MSVASKIYTFFSLFAVIFAGCFDNAGTLEIPVSGNIYLYHPGDDINSGFKIVRKRGEHLFDVIVGENVVLVQYNKKNIFAKAVYGKADTFFYHINKLEKDSILKAVTIAKGSYNADIQTCLNLKTIKIKLDSSQKRWVVSGR